jgi:HlyD family secretion protein
VSAESPRGPNIRELESLRIQRSPQPAKPSGLVPWAIGAGVLAVVAALGFVVYQRTLGRPPEVQTAVVTFKSSGQPGVLLTGSGYIVTKEKYITVGTKIQGQIVEEPIEEGKILKKGDLLARIDDRDYQALLRQSIADRDLAQANLVLARERVVRYRELYKNKVADKDQLDDAENQLAVDEAALLKAQNQIDYAKYYVTLCVIKSPINGIVLSKVHEVGDTINYGGDIQAGGGVSDIVTLADTDDMRAEVDINESDIAKVTMGEPAQVILDAYPDKPFAARVVKIYPEADRQKGTVKVAVHIIEPDLAIVKPEMSAKVTFLASTPTKQETPLVLVPKKALLGDNNPNAVWVVRNGVAVRTPVTTGREFQDGIEVKSGLSGGETVIVVPPPNIRDGQEVTPVQA